MLIGTGMQKMLIVEGCGLEWACQWLLSCDPNSVMYKIKTNFCWSEVRPVAGRLGPKRSGMDRRLLGFFISIYTSCKLSSWDKKSGKSPTFVTSPDILKICWLMPVFFPSSLEGFSTLKSLVPCVWSTVLRRLYCLSFLTNLRQIKYPMNSYIV